MPDKTSFSLRQKTMQVEGKSAILTCTCQPHDQQCFTVSGVATYWHERCQIRLWLPHYV